MSRLGGAFRATGDQKSKFMDFWPPQKWSRWQKHATCGALVKPRFWSKNRVSVWKVCKFRFSGFPGVSREGVLGEAFRRKSPRRGASSAELEKQSGTPTKAPPGEDAAADLKATPLPPAPLEFLSLQYKIRQGCFGHVCAEQDAVWATWVATQLDGWLA